MIDQELKDISYIDESPRIIIRTEPENSPYVYIYDSLRNVVLFEGSLWPDFSGRLEIELVPEIKDSYSPELPGSVASLLKNYITLKYRDEDDEDGSYHYGSVNLFSKDALEIMSDADELNVPENYILPISYVHTDIVNQAYIATRSGMIDITEFCPYDSDRPLGIISFLRSIKDFNLLPGETFRVVVYCDGDPVYSPFYTIVRPSMEQFLFYNRLGGWDNIAMSGRCTVAPEYEFSNGIKNGRRAQTSVKNTRKYKQNSGSLTMKSAIALAQLLESPAVYHLVDGAWKPVVIDAVEANIEKDADLHSITFTYMYSDDNNKFSL
ncbi:MAG: hypothetical protein ACI3Z0_03250 [Candidatus Cryptobacteroides sp.]